MSMENVNLDKIYSLPVGELGLIGMKGCEEFTERINNYLYEGRKSLFEQGFAPSSVVFSEYCRKDYRIKYRCPRFGTGEGKALIDESVRGLDIFIIIDAFNYGVTYNMYGVERAMSPDEHFQDLKRVIGAIEGKARRINVIMPMLYEGRQHRRTARESLDCAIMLQELVNLGVDNIITCDAHDARVQNAIPLHGFEDIKPVYQMIKALVNNIPDIEFNKDTTMIVSPDEGSMQRCIYYSEVLGVPLGMFYKRRDYSTVVNGRNPILSHEFLGESVEGKDVIIIDDMISSGESVLDIMGQLKERKAKRILVCASFGLFSAGIETFEKAYEEGLFYKIFTTNLVYRRPELSKCEWYCEVDMSKYFSYIINTLNHDHSLSSLLDPVDRINTFLTNHMLRLDKDEIKNV